MPEKAVSEAAPEVAQVEETPSEESQVAEPAPSEAEPEPAQEPKAELTAEQRKAILDEYLESEDYKKAIQSEADKRALKLRQEYEGTLRAERQQQEEQRRLEAAQREREQRTNTYRQLQAIKQQKPEEWAKYMENPEYAAIWAEGGRTMPSTEEVDRARGEGQRQLYGAFYGLLMSKPEMQGLSTDELARIDHNKFVGQPNAYAAYLDAITALLVEKQAAASVEKEVAKREEAIRKDERERLQQEYRKAGVGPEHIEGKPTGGALTRERYAAMSTEEREKLREENPEAIDAMARKEMGI